LGDLIAEGGIVAELPVHEGQAVKMGQPLVVLESTQARTTHGALAQQRLSLLARQARLDAERAGESRVQWPPELRSSDLQIRGIVVAQQEVFDARRSTHATRRDILAQRIEQLLQQIQGFEAQVESASQQIDFIGEELKAKEYLVARGMMPRPEALRLKRAEAEIVGRRGEHVAEIARARQQIGEAKIQILSVDAERADQIAAEQDKVRAELAEVNEKLQASADVLKRTVVIAPVNGVVVDMKFRTIGGVVPGTVRTVSADRLMDEIKHQPYYLVRVAVDRQLVKTLAPSVELIPGIPVEVLVVTERRTMLDYLAKPFRDAFWRSFREI
jgi:HlyD family secretion protein/epimerase transport system membrane fusion protein